MVMEAAERERTSVIFNWFLISELYDLWAHLCNSGRNRGRNNCSLVEFETSATGKNSSLVLEPVQKPTVREIIGPRWGDGITSS